MNQIWVCGGCKSINPLRSSRCYKCNLPRPAAGQELAAVDVPADSLAPVREAATPGSRHTTWPFAAVTIALIVASVVLRLANVVGVIALADWLEIGFKPPLDDVLHVGWFGLGWFFVALAGGLAWGVWVSRVILNLPRLGRGWAHVTPRMAIFECGLPVLNVFRTPPVMRDVTARLSSDGLPANALISAWWLTLFVSLILERPIAVVVTLFAPSLAAAIRWSVAFTVLAGVLLAVAGALAILLIAVVERNQARCARDLVATGGYAIADADAPT